MTFYFRHEPNSWKNTLKNTHFIYLLKKFHHVTNKTTSIKWTQESTLAIALGDWKPPAPPFVPDLRGNWSSFGRQGRGIRWLTWLSCASSASSSFYGSQSTVGLNDMKSTCKLLGHSLLRSLVRSHHSLIRLLRTARFAHALCCAHLFARLLPHSFRTSWERDFCLWFHSVSANCAALLSRFMGVNVGSERAMRL